MFRRNVGLTALLFACTLQGVHAATTVRYVDKNLGSGANDGTSWANAYRGQNPIATALANANPGSGDVIQIWVAGGTYRAHTISRTGTFTMKDRVELYGGFCNGDSLSERAYACNGGTHADRPCQVAADCPGGTCTAAVCCGGSNDGEACDDAADCPSGTCGRATILTGDIGLDDTTACTTDADCGSGGRCVDGFCITGNNSYHVITYNLDSDAASVVIDGFVVERGDANGGVTEQDPDGAAPDNQGGAIQIRKPPSQVCVAGGPTIRNCIIRGNYAADHGAINDHGHTTEIRNCVFRNNLARKGAGLLVEHGSPLIINSYFVGNSVITETLPDQPPREGSALWLDRRANGTSGCDSNDPSAATVVNCLFERNGRPGSGFTLLQGGGVWIGSGATPSFADCDFERNVAHLGAAVFQKSSEGDPIVYDDCTFRINSANGLWSGAMYAGSRGVILSRCTFELNYAGSLGYGGAVYANGGALVWAESSDFVANMGVKGGAMGLQMASAELLNCTVAGNIGTGSPHGGGIFIEGSGETLTASNSIFYWNLSKSGGSTYDGADAQLHASSGATASVNDSDWKGNGPTCPNRDSNDNMDCDPDFVADPYCTGICGDDPLTTSTDESVDDSAGDAHLASGSKCIDAGDDAYVAGCIDIDWQARETNDPNTTDTGDGTAPIVDIGADEFCPPSSSCPDLCPEPE